MTSKLKILQIGCGNMGFAIVEKLSASGKYDITVIDPVRFGALEVQSYVSAQELKADYKADILIFAVKPQNIKEIISLYQNSVTQNTIIISILAGVEVGFFRGEFPDNQIVRVMPNLGAKKGQSSNAIYSNNLQQENISLVNDVIGSFGNNHWLDDEELMHQVTAVSGSGPAYYFLLLELFSEYLQRSGFGAEDAKQIALETASAAIAVAKEDSDFGNLRKQVTSKGGTTDAALSVLMSDDKLKGLLDAALDAATQRSEELK